MTAGTPSFIVDADLHGLVDGHIQPERRADALRRLAASPADRVRIEAWQSQNDLLKSAFASVEREPLPAMLDLTVKPRLHCIPANDSPLAGGVGGRPRNGSRRRRFGLACATVLVIATGLFGTWMVLDSAEPDDPAVVAKVRESVGATLASRSEEAVGQPVPPLTVVSPQAGDRLPTTMIPDLRPFGFTFAGAEVGASAPISILFRYQNTASDRLVISVARAAQQDGESGAAPVRLGNAYAWRKNQFDFAIAGTLRPGRLRAIAVSLQNGGVAD